MKKLWGIFICFMLTLSLCVGIPFLNQNVNAESYTITGISIDINNEDTSKPIPDENGNYHASFKTNTVKETDPHYSTFVIKSKISTNPQTSLIDQSTINAIVWKINGSALSFNNGAIDNNEYTVQLIGKDIKFTPKLPKTFIFKNSLNGFDSNTISLISDYATPTQIKIVPSGGSLQQLYEDYSQITLKAVLNYQEYLDPSINYTFSWYKNSTDDSNKLPETSNTLVITKSMLELKKMKFFVKLNNWTLKDDSIEIEITTNASYSIKISTLGKLEQTIGKDLESLSITASLSLNEENNIKIPDKAIINWYVLTPKSNVYQKQQTTNIEYTFNPLEYSAGNYNIFARLTTIDKNEYVSNVISIKLNPKERTAPTLEIQVEKFNNNSTGVEGFKFSVDLQDYYNPENIVWLIEGQTQGTGNEITFSPTVANDYKVEVKLLDSKGEPIKSLTWKNVEAKSMQATHMWIYITVAGIVLIGICTASIIISNKKREKIW